METEDADAETARTACVMREIFAASFPSLKFGTASKSGAGTAIQRAPSARSRCTAALMSARCVKACGKLPRASPEDPQFLSVETQVVGVGEHLLQGEARFFEASCLR